MKRKVFILIPFFSLLHGGINASAKADIDWEFARKLEGTYEVTGNCASGFNKPIKVELVPNINSQTKEFRSLNISFVYAEGAQTKMPLRLISIHGSENAWKNLAKTASEVRESSYNNVTYGYESRRVVRSEVITCYSSRCDNIADGFYHDVAVDWTRIYSKPDRPSPDRLILDGSQRRGYFAVGKADPGKLSSQDFGYFCLVLKKVD